MRSRFLVLVLVLAGSLSGAAPAQEPMPPKPTIILVHGAFADSSSWNAVITDLAREEVEVPGASHVVMMSHPQRVSAIIKRAAGAAR